VVGPCAYITYYLLPLGPPSSTFPDPLSGPLTYSFLLKPSQLLPLLPAQPLLRQRNGLEPVYRRGLQFQFTAAPHDPGSRAWHGARQHGKHKCPRREQCAEEKEERQAQAWQRRRQSAAVVCRAERRTVGASNKWRPRRGSGHASKSTFLQARTRRRRQSQRYELGQRGAAGSSVSEPGRGR
jgi:hypothetical protein